MYFLSLGRSAQRRFDCLACLGGHWCGVSTIKPVPCGRGMYSETGWKKCKLCPPGFYCDLDATSDLIMKEKKQCVAGMYCGGTLKSMADARPCTKGKYCVKGILSKLMSEPSYILRVSYLWVIRNMAQKLMQAVYICMQLN